MFDWYYECMVFFIMAINYLSMGEYW
jgi:hypothetical protein